MRTYLYIVACFVTLTTLQAQEKIKGSRNVTVEQNLVDEFSAIEIGEEFEVRIVEGTQPMVEIETDDNLHEVIDIDVIGGTLYLQTIKEIRRSKRMRIRITFTDALNELRVKERAELSSLTDLALNNLTITTNGNAKVYATLNATSFVLKNNDDAKVELNVTADSTHFQLNQDSQIEALVNSATFKADLLEDAKAEIEGDVNDLLLRADNSSSFIGKNLTSQNATVLIEGRAKASVKSDETIVIQARGSSELSIYDNPKISLDIFEDEAVLKKK